eukprot:CAMPEP_0202696260 /NCGR_PEP_ID=MMETSP1385-20130828/9553_1 /ASSEMBLY_ACC=CAM_ASM_000861 /TAXON_ID=933848 /ORGANISM="Elphidium margaritaceum" /LENGTH=364 /DNA_ID=CAMNT_0049352377 /DNA_START=38 /DNA_END=1132 /DNA_ORIENTATION=-
MAAESDMTYDEAQAAVDNGDEVTASELAEMHPDKNMDRILYDISKEQQEMELQAKLDQMYEFNEPRAAAKQGRKTVHTGPKGVLTDQMEARLKMRARRIEEKIYREKHGNYMALDSSVDDTQHKLTIVDQRKQWVSAKQKRREHKLDSKDNEEGDSDDALSEDDMDELALQRYKLQRMKILEAHQPRFGDTKELTAWTFDEEVEHAPHNVWVVVHVYQDYMERCARMNYALGQIAKSYPHIKFMRARSDRLGLDNYPEVGLPTLIVFRNGKQLQNHIAMHTQIAGAFEVKDVEAFLIKNGVMKPVVIIPDGIEDASDTRNEAVYTKKTTTRARSDIRLQNNSNVKLAYKTKVQNDSDDSELDID